LKVPPLPLAAALAADSKTQHCRQPELILHPSRCLAVSLSTICRHCGVFRAYVFRSPSSRPRPPDCLLCFTTY